MIVNCPSYSLFAPLARARLPNLRRHEPDLTPDRTWWREAHELQGLHSHTGSISWARTRETRRAQNAGTCGELNQPGRCGSGVTNSTFFGVSDAVGFIYLGTAATLGTYFIYLAWKLKRDYSIRKAKHLYLYSLLYLALLFAGMMVDSVFHF